MFVDTPTPWSILLLMFCSLALFIEAINFARASCETQRGAWRFFLFLLPLAVSLCSITRAVLTFTQLSTLPSPQFHLSVSIMQHAHALLQTDLELCHIQIGVSITAFILLLLLERKFGIKDVSFLTHLHHRNGGVRF